jgi:hypothetical protein
MPISRRDLVTSGAAGAITSLGVRAAGSETAQGQTRPASIPWQVATDRPSDVRGGVDVLRGYDMRNDLNPRRLTMAMWDVAFALRHAPGGSFADFDKVLDEAVEREYNTIRIDPMPQWIDYNNPDRIIEWPDPHQPYMPWLWNTGVRGPVGAWVIDFMQKLLRRKSLYYTLSAWWFAPGVPTSPRAGTPELLRNPANMTEGAEMWATMLTAWKKRFGFDHLVYVDVANETPYFFPHQMERFKKETGEDFEAPRSFSPTQIAFFANEINPALKLLRQEFPELRFTTSLHGDMRWFDVPLELDCLDVHFYADSDPRWNERTRFGEFINDHLFETDRWFAEFSERSMKTASAIAPMLRARQRYKMSEFAHWAARRGSPLTTSEAWASWFYIDHPKLDWGWLLDWAKWSVDDAIACGFWGWTPHNYVQPQFANWKNAEWHRALNERFLHS